MNMLYMHVNPHKYLIFINILVPFCIHYSYSVIYHLFIQVIVYLPESNSEGPDRLRPPGCQGDGVFGSEEVCTQRPGSTQLHVSQGT